MVFFLYEPTNSSNSNLLHLGAHNGTLQSMLSLPLPVLPVALPKASSELTRVQGTPIPFANCIQSKSGRPISNISRARVPGFPYSQIRKLTREDGIAVVAHQTAVVTLKPSCAFVHNNA